MAENILTAGVARVDITPPIGFRMQGQMRRVEGAEGIHSPLLATALVIADESTKIVILDCDLIGFDLPLAERIREAIGNRIGASASNVLLGCTHTHNGPSTARGFLAGPHDVAARPGEVEALDHYIDNLVWQLVGVASVADSQRQPARVGAASDLANVAINREEVDPEDGKVLVGRNPDGVTDRAVDVLRIDDLQGNAIAVIVAYAAHPVVTGFNGYLYSQDYPGVVRRVVEGATGATCLFLTGAAGNQACWSFLQDDWSEQERMGGRIGGAAVNAFYQIETRPHEVIRQRGMSLSLLAQYHKEFHPGPTHQVLCTAHGVAKVKLQPLPSLEEAQVQVAQEQATLEQMVTAGESTTSTVPQQLNVRWAAGVLEKVKAGELEQTLEYPLVGFRIDDFVLLGMPGEPFVEIQLGAKQRSNARHTMFAGYANGILAYIPVAQTVRQGGMSVSSAVRTYNIPAPPVESSVDDVLAAFDKLLEELGV
ncbi:MAG: neutral/alkaline non-lysosomal ceramidase N-terminal domain-containing protein [Pirellulaceae bacterium]|nr:neutral/alkaline non-lysosomal ceramidase N-terminal domain-containing protein [Pirellulaceae bacterium]